ncbi:MAG: ABC transporter permease [Candidatus Tectomicrobia bacterium]|nr:ABC transporter permease [Candidatus Tectomicrobia bacterium]
MRKLWVYLLRTLLFALCVAAWELGARGNPELTEFFPPLSLIFPTAVQSIAQGELPRHLGSSLATFLKAYALAAFIGLTGGVLLGRWRWLFHLFEPPIELLRPLPTPAMIPIAILIFGIDESMRIAITVYACTWPILLNTIDGVRGAEPVLIHTAHTFGASERQLLLKVILRAASPQMVTGLRISLGIALILVVTSEMIAAVDGIGFYILETARNFEVAEMFGAVLVLALLGYLLNKTFVSLEGRAMAWYYGSKKREAR